MAIPNENTSREKKKGKKPPSFHHLGKLKAAKLKKEWVEKAKIRSQWSKQKRREQPDPRNSEGLASEAVEGGDERAEGENESHLHADGVSGPAQRKPDGEETARKSGEKKAWVDKKERGKRNANFVEEKKQRSQSTKGKQPDEAARRSFKGGSRRDCEREGGPQPDAKDNSSKPSMRELTRAAYSPASLHNVKSNPRHRHHNSGPVPLGNGGKDRSQRKGGQPNMKLRMEAMLERIKRDFS